MITLGTDPGPGSPGLRGSSFHSLCRLSSKLKALPSPAQNQSKRCRSMVIFEITTLLISPPVAICRVSPRLESKIVQFVIRISRITRLLPSLNLIAAEAEERRQLVTVMCSHDEVGPHSSIPHTKTMQSSPVAIVLFEMLTSLQLTISIPSAHTASCRLV